ncbi:MAG: FAD-binding oxidoreductase [Anaerolineaceae bacterium]|nr:FAD-binding oxidoreductase [Anaerolineaceae bacterium]
MTGRQFYWLVLYFLTPAIPTLLILSAPTSQPGNWLYVASVILGACAFVWLVNQFVLSARPKYIEQFFGLDKMYRFHTLMAVVSITLAFVHRGFKLYLTGFNPPVGQAALLLFGLIGIISMIFMVDSGLRKAPPIAWLHRFSVNKLGLKFNRVVLLHNFTLVAALLLLVHVLASRAARSFLPVQLFYVLYFAFGLSFYIYHKLVRRIRLNRNAYRVEAVTQESLHVRTLTLTQPAGAKALRYKAGQFAFITILGEGIAREEHPFTISSSPANSGWLSFTIKELGDFTASLGRVQPGSRVWVDGPYGSFSYQNIPAQRRIVFIVGGIGITPVLSMLRTMQLRDQQRQATLLWGVNQSADLIYADEFTAFEKELTNFRWHPVVAFDAAWQGEKGIIDQEKISRLALEPSADTWLTDFFVCGPPKMMETTLASLKTLRIPRRQIHVEKFSL